MSKFNPAAIQHTGVTSLPYRRHLMVTGSEAKDFLQAILTQDMAMIGDRQSIYTAFCSAKGRCHALFIVTPFQDGFALAVQDDLLEFVQKRLQMFVLRRDVQITPLADYRSIGVLVKAKTSLNIDGLPTGLYALTGDKVAPLTTDYLSDGWVIAEQRGGQPRLTLTAPESAINTIKTALEESLGRIAASDFERAEIQDRIPAVYQATENTFVPQWLNLDELNAFSLKKGCYPGQEVIARLHYLGKPNRRMFAGHALGVRAFSPGTDIVNQDDQVVGEIVRSVEVGDDCQFLAVMKLKHLHDSLQINGAPVTLEHTGPLPENLSETTH